MMPCGFLPPFTYFSLHLSHSVHPVWSLVRVTVVIYVGNFRAYKCLTVGVIVYFNSSPNYSWPSNRLFKLPIVYRMALNDSPIPWYKYCDGLVFVRFVSFRFVLFSLLNPCSLLLFFLTSFSSTCLWIQYIRRRRRRCFSFWHDKATVRWIDDNRNDIGGTHRERQTQKQYGKSEHASNKQAKKSKTKYQRHPKKNVGIDVWWNEKMWRDLRHKMVY